MSNECFEKSLWQAVLWRAAQDIAGAKDPFDRDFENVARWVGNYPSRDFKEVCSLAGFEYDFVHPKLKSMIAETLLAHRKIKSSAA